MSVLKFKGKCVSSSRICLRNHLMMRWFQRCYDGMFCGKKQDSESFSFFKCADLVGIGNAPFNIVQMLGKVAIRLARAQQLGSKRTKSIVPLLPLTYNNRKEEGHSMGVNLTLLNPCSIRTYSLFQCWVDQPRRKRESVLVGRRTKNSPSTGG